ncbi:MAG: 5,6-dimethylbenzimidazole synthase [Pseudomonadales bacterium]
MTTELSQQLESLYRVIFSRRDVRGQFLPDPIPDEVLSRLLYAAHHAPSVGYMQPWNFLLVKSPAVKQRVHAAFVEANEEARQMFQGERRALYSSLKLEGILESPLNICITCDRNRTGETVLGRTHQSDMDLYSSVCAVQNFWLAARAENVGVGWVSIAKPTQLREALAIPEEIIPIAYLCVGYVSEFFDQPELERKGWLPRLPLNDLIYYDQWGQQGEDEPLAELIERNKNFPQLD